MDQNRYFSAMAETRKKISAVFYNKMVLLHGFIKKRQATPLNDMRTAKRRMAKFQ
jgi:phage-related protein